MSTRPVMFTLDDLRTAVRHMQAARADAQALGAALESEDDLVDRDVAVLATVLAEVANPAALRALRSTAAAWAAAVQIHFLDVSEAARRAAESMRQTMEAVTEPEDHPEQETSATDCAVSPSVEADIRVLRAIEELKAALLSHPGSKSVTASEPLQPAAAAFWRELARQHRSIKLTGHFCMAN